MARKYYTEDRPTNPRIAFWEANEVLPGYAEITDRAAREELHAKRYTEMENVGVKYYHQFQAQLYCDIIDAIYTTTEVVAVEAHLENLSNLIRAGNFITADNYIETLAFSGIYQQAMYNQIKADLAEFIIKYY